MGQAVIEALYVTRVRRGTEQIAAAIPPLNRRFHSLRAHMWSAVNCILGGESRGATWSPRNYL